MARGCAPGDRNSVRGPCTAWHLAVRCAPLGGDCKTMGLRRALAPGSDEVPLVGLNLFRLAALGPAPGGNSADYDSCMCCVLSNDAILGSGDVVP